MTPAATVTASTGLVVLADSALRSLVLAAVAGLTLAAFRVRSSSLRLFTWTAVLYAALAMPLLGSILPALPIPAPAFLRFANLRETETTRAKVSTAETRLSHTESANPGTDRQASSRISISASLSTNRDSRDAPPRTNSKQDEPAYSRSTLPAQSQARVLSPPPPSSRNTSPLLGSIPWTLVAYAIYLGLVFILLARMGVGFAFSRRLLRAAMPIIDDARMTAKLAACARCTGLAIVPSAFESDLISVPLTMGVWRSAILLPASWRDWDDAELDAVLAHEVSHIARRDALTQRLSLLHRAIFWFSPLAWWLDRHLANLAEQVSDEAALSGGADRHDYARTLLGFFEALHAAPARVWWQGVSMAKAGQAEERVERILAWKGSNGMNFKRWMAVLVVAVAVPAVYFTAAVQANYNGAAPQHLPYIAQDQDQTPPASPSAPTAPKAPSSAMPPAPVAIAPVAPSSEPSELTPPAADTTIVVGAPAASIAPPAAVGPGVRGVITGVPGVAPVAPGVPIARGGSAVIAPVAPVPPSMWAAQKIYAADSGKDLSYRYSDDNEERFVIVSANTDSFTMSGSEEDSRHARKLRKEIPGNFIWFERDEKSYIIRDQAIFDRVRKLWEPMDELGKQQEALGKQQEALGAQQEELGKQMEEVHVKLPDMSADLEKLKAEMKNLSSGATIEQVGELQSEIGELQSRIGEIQSQAGSEQSKVGAQMGALGRKQGDLGRQQGELGRKQGELAREAQREMHKIFDEAIANGKAQPEPEI
jgi:beta-lactamase regulating signal transducer with metallopeptidase domain